MTSIDTLCPCGNDTDFRSDGERIYCARCNKPLTRRNQSLELLFARLWKNRPSDNLPDPVRNYPVLEGKRKNQPYTSDFVWPDLGVIVEIDGGQHAPGGGRHATDKDRDKLNRLTVMGWAVLRFSGEMLKRDPERCVKQTTALLINRAKR